MKELSGKPLACHTQPMLAPDNKAGTENKCVYMCVCMLLHP